MIRGQKDGLSEILQTRLGHFELLNAHKRFGEMIHGQ